MSILVAVMDRRRFLGFSLVRSFIAALVMWAPVGIRSVAHAEVSSGVTNSSPTNDFSGVYRDEDGTEAVFYAPEEASQYVLHYVKSGEAPMTVYLQADSSALAPVSMDVTVRVNGTPMEISGWGDRLYARTSSTAGKSLEYLSDSEKGIRRAVGGRIGARDESAEDAEIGMALGDFSQQWQRFRHAKVILATNSLLIASPGGAQPRSFRKQEALSTNEVSVFGERIQAHKNVLSAVDAFINNERKIEVAP